MKRKLFKIVTVLLVLALLVMPNFIYVGVGLASYAVSDSATNHQNIDFDAKLKEGNILNLNINVKREGYFNGEITAVENQHQEIDTVTGKPCSLQLLEHIRTGIRGIIFVTRQKRKRVHRWIRHRRFSINPAGTVSW